jgi:hypothetical protein
VHIPPQSFVICIHACNECNKVAMDMAKEAGAMYASMPCCIRDGMYGLHGARHVSDDVRSVLSTTKILNDRNALSLRSIRWPFHPAKLSNIL